jgi:HopA1 effector protein family
MPEPLDSVARCLRETTIYSETTFSCMGSHCARLSPRIRRVMSANTARSYLIHQLQSRLYSRFYIRGNCSGSNWGETQEAESATFARALSTANAGSGCWDSDWSVAEVNAEEIVVSKGGLKVHVRYSEDVLRGDSPLDRGAPVMLHLAKELLSASPGYYMAVGNYGGNGAEPSQLVRLYWNLRASGAIKFINGFTRVLNDAGIYFRLKVLNDPAAYMRTDAGVLYFCKADRNGVANAVLNLYPLIAPFLNPDIPALTRRIAPGIGLAEDPGTQESFGQHRCRVLAQAIVVAHEQGAKNLSDRLRIVESHFASQGIRLTEPHLNPHSEDDYNFANVR